MKQGVCDGQSVYVAHKIDGAVLVTLRDYLAKIKSTPKDIALEKRYKSEKNFYKYNILLSSCDIYNTQKMRHILVIGAGRSASSLIKYLLENSEKENLHITIGDLSEELAKQKTKNHKNATAIA